MRSDRRFPPPWDIEEANASCFIVKDNNGQALAYVYFESGPGRRTAANLLRRDATGAERVEGRGNMLLRCVPIISCPRNPRKCLRIGTSTSYACAVGLGATHPVKQ
jgi:hypothetical protein